MPDPNPLGAGADRNLLFGILALQMDFINRDALIAAMNAWVLDKAKPLGRILVELNALTEARRAMLAPLVDEHVKAHGGDAQQSMAALSPVSWIRKALAEVNDADVQASLAAAGAIAPANPESTIDLPKFAGLRYRVLRPHAKGGLGEVHVAEDQELHREVALKEIRTERAHDPVSRGRFLLEAEVTGRLEHPGIVPVYGLGTYADGRPFYAMRFIRGDNLKEAIARFHDAEAANRDPGERSLAFRQLLRRFIDVCNAVAYAHSRGVLHRDLKPGNVMLGKYGETLLVDWGLAKTVGRPEPTADGDESTIYPISGSSVVETHAGVAMGTPAFMSPEQAAGKLDELGPASDVYSLGATLYMVLTGRTAFVGANAGEVLAMVRLGEFPSSRQVKSDTPPALDAICRRAMALKPADRYATALELAADMEHWLADEPVAAYRESISTRVARWSRRHRALVAGIAALLVTAVVALTIGMLLVGREKAIAVANFQEAKNQRRRAEANLRKAGDATDRMLTRVAQRLAGVPQVESLRRELLEDAVEFNRTFLAENAGDQLVATEAGRAYTRLANLYWYLGQQTNAGEACRQAISVLRIASANAPEDAVPQYELAVALIALGVQKHDTNSNPDAEAAFREALQIAEKLATDYSEELPFRQLVGKCGHRLGTQLSDKLVLQRAVETYDRLLADFPDRPDIAHELGGTLNDLALRLHRLEELEEARERFDQAIGHQETALKADPANPTYRLFARNHWYNLALVLRDQENPAAAEKACRRANSIAEKLATDFPQTPMYGRLHAWGLVALAGMVSHADKREEIEKALRRSVDLYAKLSVDFPHIAAIKHEFGGALNNLANNLSDQGDLPEKHRLLQRAINEQRSAVEASPGSARYKLFLAQHYANLSYTLAELKNHCEAAQAVDEALRVCPTLATDVPYTCACSLARCSLLVEKDERIPEADRKHSSDAYRSRAVQCFKQAIQNGYKDVHEIKNEKDLDPLRQREDFKQLLIELEQKYPQRSPKLNPKPTEPPEAAERMEQHRLAVWMVAGWPVVR